ncbi:5'(3')-deoxyribonucleotidase, cytosolic type [Emydura macquarii macquarii]|uniref:5'(3')-deoxyribonucleotidase, cytosolic type n=1 Tax=Emydura macquarii macquarii TaxID=1129001 RepID=UPI00352AB2F1
MVGLSAPPLRVRVDTDGVQRAFFARYSGEPPRGAAGTEGRLGPGAIRCLREDLGAMGASVYESLGFFLGLELIPGAIEAMQEMIHMQDTEVFICTSPLWKYEHCIPEKYSWVEKHMGPKFVERLILTWDKTIVSADLLIDDTDTIKGAESAPSWEHILFTCCHNKHLELQTPNRRLQSWADDWRAIVKSKCREGIHCANLTVDGNSQAGNWQ